MNPIYFVIVILLCFILLILGGCKRNDCYKEVLKLAPTYIELRYIYKQLKPKAIELHNKGLIDDITWKQLKDLDTKLTNIDEKAKLFYNKAVDLDSLSDEDVKLIIGVTREIVQAISFIVPKII